MTTTITFTNGNLSNVAISSSSVEFTARWMTTTASVRITRNAEGFIYEDLGFMTRHFTDIEYLCWEFNYDEGFLRPILESLVPTAMPTPKMEITSFGQDWLDAQVKSVLNQVKRGSNYTKPKNRKKKK